MVGVLEDFLFFGFIADFRSPKDDRDAGTDAFEQRGDPGGTFDVPDVAADAYDPRMVRENLFNGGAGLDLDIELQQFGLSLQFTEVGEQVARTEGGVSIAGVERGNNNFSRSTAIHGATV